MKNTNIHAQQLAAEAKAREAKEAREAMEAEKAEILAREEAHKGEPTFDVFETVQLLQNKKHIIVTLKVFRDDSRTETIEIPICGADSEESAQKCIDDLRRYAINGQLLTVHDVIIAVDKKMRNELTGKDILDAGIIPERKIMVDNTELYSTNGTEIRRAEDSKLIKTVNCLPQLDDKAVEEVVVPAVREALKKSDK